MFHVACVECCNFFKLAAASLHIQMRAGGLVYLDPCHMPWTAGPAHTSLREPRLG